MKIYEIKLWDSYYNYIETLKLKSPINIKDLDKYFLEYENLYCIEGCNKKGLVIYVLYKNKTFDLFLYSKENEMVYREWSDGEIEYPYGKEKYDEYMRDKKKEKLEGILNEIL